MKKVLSLVIVAVFSCLALCSCGEDNKMLSYIEIDGKKISCGMDMDEVLDSLSDYSFDYSETISCAYNGLDKIYDFTEKGFIIYTYPEGDKDYVLEVAVSSEAIFQKDGKVKIGMSKGDVEALFGTEYEVLGDTITYTVKDKQTMYFLIDEDKVIEYAISVAE